MPSFGGNLLTQRHQITSVETRNSGLSSGENPESLSDLGLIRYRVVVPVQTDGQTDRIPIANTRSQQYLTVQLSRVKKHASLIQCMKLKPCLTGLKRVRLQMFTICLRREDV